MCQRGANQNGSSTSLGQRYQPESARQVVQDPPSAKELAAEATMSVDSLDEGSARWKPPLRRQVALKYAVVRVYDQCEGRDEHWNPNRPGPAVRPLADGDGGGLCCQIDEVIEGVIELIEMNKVI